MRKNAATGHLLARALSHALSFGGLGLAGYGIGRSVLAGHRAREMMAQEQPKPYRSLRASGRLPPTARVLTNADDIKADMYRAVERTTGKKPGWLARSAADAVADDIANGRNAAFQSVDAQGRPVFYGGYRGISPSIASHETGHYRAAMRRTTPAAYTQEYLNAGNRFPRPGDILERNMWYDGDRLSQPGLEREAWEMGPGYQDPRVRDAALETYKANRVGRAAALYGTGTGITGIALFNLLRHLR